MTAAHVGFMRPRYWMLRMYVAMSASLTMWVIWSEPASLGHGIISRSGTAGWYCVTALAFVCALSLIDTLLNDMAHIHLRWECARRWRHWLYMMLALGLTSVAYVAVMAVGYTSLVLPLLLDAGVAVMVAVTDLFHRHRSADE